MVCTAVQLFYNLSDPGMEDMLSEAESVRRFVGLRHLGRCRFAGSRALARPLDVCQTSM